MKKDNPDDTLRIEKTFGNRFFDYFVIEELNKDEPATYKGFFIKMYPFLIFRVVDKIKESYLKIVDKSYLYKLLGEEYYKPNYPNGFGMYELLTELITTFRDSKIKALLTAQKGSGRTRRSKTKRTRSKHIR